MKVENVETMGWKAALHGMRHPKESYHLSDSRIGYTLSQLVNEEVQAVVKEYLEKNKDASEIEVYEMYLRGVKEVSSGISQYTLIGPKDLDLALRLIHGGSEHRKFLRMIHIQADITAPLYWWKEFDTYKVGTTANSTSTMHKLATTPITQECFEMDDYTGDELFYSETFRGRALTVEVQRLFTWLEQLRHKYLGTKDKRYWKELIRWLPESWLQTRTVDLDYETALNMYFQREYHKLSEWHFIANWIKELPYMKIFIERARKNG